MIKLHVMVVDDEPDIREIVGLSLARDPFFEFRTCASGEEALATALEWRPDLTLLDIMMPRMDGLTVLARLRADKRTRPIPVVFLTARAREHKQFRALGADGLIPKPFNPMKLPEELRRFIPLETTFLATRNFVLERLNADARALSACRPRLSQTQSAVARVGEIAQTLTRAGGTYGFAGITCESAALLDAAVRRLSGRAEQVEVEQALDRLLQRIQPT